MRRRAMLHNVDYVLAKLAWKREQRIWPNSLRYLWTDAFGMVLLVSLYRELGEESWIDQAEQLVAEVERVLGRPLGFRIGEAPNRDEQYYHISCHVAVCARAPRRPQIQISSPSRAISIRPSCFRRRVSSER